MTLTELLKPDPDGSVSGPVEDEVSDVVAW
jgi:hypothetical protein